MPNLVVDITLQKKSRKTLKWYLQRYGQIQAAPTEEALQKYYRFVEHSYLRALREQLDNSSGAGYATGKLQRSIRVEVRGGQGTGWNHGIRISILSVSQKMENYGRNISEGRHSGGGASHHDLIEWINTKIANGTMRNIPKNNRRKRQMAYWINQKLKNEGYTAPLPFWNRYDKNSELKEKFKKIYNTSKSRHVKILSDSIINNLRQARKNGKQ